MADPNLEMELMQLAFGDTSDASGELISKLGKEYAPGETLFAEGDRGQALFLLLKGEVEVLAAGRRLATIGSGQILGEMSHFDSRPRSASCKALTQVNALVLDKESFGLIFQLHPKWTLQLVEGLASRITKTLRSVS